MPRTSEKPIIDPEDAPTQPLDPDHDESMNDAGVTNDEDTDDTPMPPPGGPGTKTYT